ncbi:MAG: arginine--tRNA ligase [Candidatus Nealsonbacteria bacterium RIFOXYB1_FULL_40_15]|uniref:Arginine--tRNA ligase n=2 Tax=Candidatus Nealsoniibacteriota TaxID=1817911 RepID=A0A1G2ETH8_9BACT|nr:MAG: arginine--tRNA ligase [Candidatus Nealsonbacteria bacterium RIFOXYB1_FULL_40_15]OGZ28475.1 MAG: arginine--tRNA ligase [Candidatus Nealsonbacteria bacterium RIFOXYD1_FULL_39_11]OGZ29086.1 MAG: arginine--tRNA ligase [Candidatus Nealsonbacteria bacterium RIFOXYC1_FULL_40_7]
MIEEKIKNFLNKAVKELRIEPFDFSIEISKEKDYGDYSSNIAMILAKKENKNPLEIASIIKEKIKDKIFEKVEVAGPGFINFFLSDEYLGEELKKVLKEKKEYGCLKRKKKETVIVDYSGVNIAKPFGIGHLRSTVIGQAIYNMYKCLGYKVLGDNHIGDWGTQFGKLIYAIKEWGDKKIQDYSVKDLVSLYIKFHEESEKHPEMINEARQWFERLEKGDKEARRIWKECVKTSLKEFDRVYSMLGINIDMTLGESFYEPMLKDVVEEALEKGVVQKSQGALIIPLKTLPPLMILKSDGSTLYSTRDLAAIRHRVKKFKPSLIIYEVGSEQSLHFKQVFESAELLGWIKKEKLVHVPHGLIRLKTGKMSTRKGEIIFLQDVLEEAVRRAEEIIERKNPDLKEKKKIAKIIGIGAVKYNDLSSHPSTDIIFDWDKILNLEGNSGPYLQYACLRAKKILKKSKTKLVLKKIEFTKKEEKNLARKIQQYPFVLEKAAESFSPNLISNYLFDLSKEFNSFYENIPVLKAEENKSLRLSLVYSASLILEKGLEILGIEVPEEI